MTKNEFLRKLESIIEVDEGTLTGSEALESFDGWGSLAVLSFIAMLDKKFGVKVSAPSVYQCRTVEELARLAGDGIVE